MENGLIYGRLPVLEYLRAAHFSPSSTLLIASGVKESSISDIIASARKQKLGIENVDRDLLTKQCGGDKNTQGVAIRNCPLYPILDEDSLADIAEANGTLLVLDQLTDPHNIGAIIRSAEAFGAAGVIMTKDNSASITATVVKSSAGATAHMPLLFVTNLARSLDMLKDRGFWIIGSSDKGDNPPKKIADFAPAAIVIGSEGAGMRDLTGKKCDLIVRIELSGKVSSLNASVAAALLLYETTRN
ncbi:MAG: 23S rRNA (guanosine(2251)-2'-O)-methyltransferase RlmB [Spirochaetes bacterium]|jgi:23S rRNA (guanosine2251-2'-O)-methyltransferase|nr:23S rRNA (guanosine(2251)-2'-O)-methyltransferase RlmB [Spirochaetota bacterium]